MNESVLILRLILTEYNRVYKMHYYLLILLASAHSLLLTQPQEVIIIGAGISGLRCSQILAKENIPHLVIESKPNVGGRIAQTLFGGMLMDTGASMLYDFNVNRNTLARAAKEQGWAFSKADFDFDTMFYDDWEGLAEDKQELKTTKGIYQRYLERVSQIARYQKTYKSLEDLLNRALTEKSKNVQDYKELIRLMVESQGNIKGADLSQLSAQFTSLNQNGSSVYLLGTFFRFFQKLFPLDLSLLRLSQTVLSVDYSKELIKVTTNRRVYLTKKLISSIPLGALQANSVTFTPSLPSSYQKAISNIGNGVVEKLFVSFKKPFWGQRKGWLHLLSKKYGSRYSTAFILPHTTEHVLIFYLSGNAAVQVGKKTEPEILADLNKYLWLFFDEPDFEIKEVEYTNWHRDPNFQGSFSFFKLTTNPNDFAVLSKPIDKRLWLIGEHTHPKLNGLAQGAYETGERAAKQILATFNRLVTIQYAQEHQPFKTHVYQKMISLKRLYTMLQEYKFIRIQ